jgi:hypothetical protein
MVKKHALAEGDFWSVIAKFDWNKTGDDDAVMAPAVALLASKSEAQIESFADHLAEKLHALDTREHARSDDFDPDDGDQYLSADDFLYSRCCAVANGARFYAGVLKNPKKMPHDMEFESLLLLPAQAWEAKTGREFTYASKTDFETFANKKGWKPTRQTKKGRHTGKHVPPLNRRPA